MKQEIIVRLHKSFEEAAHEKDGVEFWFARDLQDLLGYTQWRNFLQVIDKAKTAYTTAVQSTDDHFADVSKLVNIGSGAEKPLADFIPTITIKAKDFAIEITNFNIRKDDLNNEQAITAEHIKNNQHVRGALLKSGIVPEMLPAEEDIKKIERKVKSADKKLSKETKKLKKKGE